MTELNMYLDQMAVIFEMSALEELGPSVVVEGISASNQGDKTPIRYRAELVYTETGKTFEWVTRDLHKSQI